MRFNFGMLEALVGSKTVQKILIFLFVNGKCYGTQLHQVLKTALTPLQKALIRLEKGGIVVSYYEGKTRLYQFNQGFALLPELEHLLRKAYTLLPANEKKKYYVAKESSVLRSAYSENKVDVLFSFWGKLALVQHLHFHAKTNTNEELGWNGKGRGEVSVTAEAGSVLVFKEKGSWQNQLGEEMNFSNTFRWTLDRQNGLIALEHLRLGANHPVFLFHLAPTGNQALSSVDAHLCSEDVYFGHIHFDAHSIRLNWRVIGPKKNENISYIYTYS